MKKLMNRRDFLAVTGAAAAVAAVMPRQVWAATESKQQFLIRTEQEEGLVSPLLHGQFAEHLGSCDYGGLWVGEDSPIHNVAAARTGFLR